MKAISRGARMLRTALGPAIAMWLKVPAVVEVMLHPDGRLQVDRLTEGLADTGDCPPQTSSWALIPWKALTVRRSATSIRIDAHPCS
jgi:Flp pilus assembly CpaF family ATPase